MNISKFNIRVVYSNHLQNFLTFSNLFYRCTNKFCGNCNCNIYIKKKYKNLICCIDILLLQQKCNDPLETIVSNC